MEITAETEVTPPLPPQPGEEIVLVPGDRLRPEDFALGGIAILGSN